MTKRGWRRLETSLGLLGIVLGLSCTEFWTYLDRTRPTTPDFAAGFEIRLDTHGSTVYITRRDHFLLDASEVACGLMLAGGAMIDIAKKPFRPDYPEPK